MATSTIHTRAAPASVALARGRLSALAALSALVLLAAANAGCGSKPAKEAPPEPAERVLLIAPRGELDALPREFSWETHPASIEYALKISDADAIWPMFVKRVGRPPLVMTDDELRAITPGRIYAWEVEAMDASGYVRAKGSAQFRVKPPEPPPS